MYCKDCGAELPPGAKFCTVCGSDQTTAPQQQTFSPSSVPSRYPASTGNYGKPGNYLVLSVLVTLCCCTPFGVVALIYASQVDSCWNRGNVEEAWKNSRLARNWSLWGLGLTIVFWILYIILIVVGVLAEEWNIFRFDEYYTAAPYFFL